ncbi:hypothetical protein M2347_003049 [Chryseobacterium sp. H1D6B]|uniref:hypothetical protein n=1 Tax=Chryseobacterium sp. H1D6B TaxID=2940588 RepID=UPI0015C73D13|nr:hypothetical protein [Chryseobacterium sp. H1D6B]MDH6253322.1 hypothetical protein [Chryseobacterium sp. H1D6B]
MQKINQFNQYLLEKYPTVWNTKIVWMLLAGLFVHILFFIIGYLSHTDPASFQTFSVRDDYFKSGVIFIHLIISILMIVGWLIMMLKNNAFKDFYPVSKWKLFSQFVQYFVIIFVSTTFFFSYMAGFRMFVDQKYPDAVMKKNIEIINRTSPFFSQNLESYTLNNRKFPKPFSDLFCETDINKIDRNKKYYVYYDRVYQYYSVYSKTSDKLDKAGNYIVPEPEDSNNTPVAYFKEKENTKTFYFKKEVVDVSSYIKTTGLSYYNFSDVFYENDPVEKRYLRRYNYSEYQKVDDAGYEEKAFAVNKETADLLDKNNIAELENLFSDFLKISKEYKIKNNLDAKEWAKMVYSPQNFEVRYFIKKYKTEAGEEYNPNNSEEYAMAAPAADSKAVVDDNGNIVQQAGTVKEFNPEIHQQVSPEKYFKEHITPYYFYTDNLKDLLTNVDSVKSNDFFSENIHIYLWIAFFLAVFVFSFRITGLRSLLFSVISAGVLILAVTLISVLYSVSVKDNSEFFIAYFVLIISLVILVIPLFMMRKAGKMVSSIFINISMNGFVLFVFLIFGIITIHQKADCTQPLNGSYKQCQTIIDYLDFNLSYIILICGFLFMYFYTAVLQKWKAMPQ